MTVMQKSMSSTGSQGGARLRPAAAYVRVSTKRQAEHELSLTEQKAAIAEYAAKNDLQIVAEYCEAGATGTTDRRPELQRLVRDAARRPAPFEVVLVFNYSRFFRNAEEFAAYKLKLAKCGAKLHSVTQDFGTGPHADLLTQIMTAIDAYASQINAEQVKLVMRANAEAGFSNGARPPFGYKLVDDRQVGKKIKKKLAVEDDEADLVRRIFSMYLRGVQGSGPMGLKAICTHLNAERVRLRGRPLMTSTVSDMLQRTTYVGKHLYNLRDSRAGKARPPEEWIEVPCPAIIEQTAFDAVQRRLAANRPSVTAPRRVNSPTLLARVGRCGEPGCTSSLLLMTGKGGRYRYLTCQTKRTQSRDACTLRNFPAEQVDDAVISALEERLLTPERLQQLLEKLIDRSDHAQAERRARIGQLRVRQSEATAAVSRLWDAIERGLALPTDTEIRGRLEHKRIEIATLGEQIAAIELQDRDQRGRIITPIVLERFAAMMREALRGPDAALRQGYIQMIVGEVRLSNAGLVIRGSTNDLELAISQAATMDNLPVPTFARKWRARNDSNVRPSDS